MNNTFLNLNFFKKKKFLFNLLLLNPKILKFTYLVNPRGGSIYLPFSEFSFGHLRLLELYL